MHPSLPSVDCEDPACDRKGDAGFDRRDEMVEHLWNVHKAKTSRTLTLSEGLRIDHAVEPLLNATTAVEVIDAIDKIRSDASEANWWVLSKLDRGKAALLARDYALRQMYVRSLRARWITDLYHQAPTKLESRSYSTAGPLHGREARPTPERNVTFGASEQPMLEEHRLQCDSPPRSPLESNVPGEADDTRDVEGGEEEGLDKCEGERGDDADKGTTQWGDNRNGDFDDETARGDDVNHGPKAAVPEEYALRASEIQPAAQMELSDTQRSNDGIAGSADGEEGQYGHSDTDIVHSAESLKRNRLVDEVPVTHSFRYATLEEQGLIRHSNVPENRRAKLYLNVSNPSPDAFVFAIHYEGRSRAFVELNATWADLSEMQRNHQDTVDIEYMELDVGRLLALLDAYFAEWHGEAREHTGHKVQRSDDEARAMRASASESTAEHVSRIDISSTDVSTEHPVERLLLPEAHLLDDGRPRPTLREILANTAPAPWTLSAFMAYLSNNHCSETLEFMLEARWYQRFYEVMMSRASVDGRPLSTDRFRNKIRGTSLADTYIRLDGSRQVNLPSGLRDLLLNLPKGLPPTPETIELAIESVYEQMEGSILVPFLDSVYQISPQPAYQNNEKASDAT